MIIRPGAFCRPFDHLAAMKVNPRGRPSGEEALLQLYCKNVCV
jgi:hypothetical protein